MARRRRGNRRAGPRRARSGWLGLLWAVAIGCAAAVVTGGLPGVPSPLVWTGALAVPLAVVAVRGWRRRRRRRVVRTLDGLIALTPTQFEETAAVALRRAGFRSVRRVGGSGDRGADLLARDAAGRPVVVQCKRYARDRSVGSLAIQTLLGTQRIFGAERALFVTTAGFTAPAVGLAAEHGVELIDGPALVRLLAREHADPAPTDPTVAA